MSRKDNVFRPALNGKKIPILTLDNKWHQLFDNTESNSYIKSLETQLNELIKRQGKLNTEIKDIKKLKKKLMEEIVSLMDLIGEKEPDKKTSKKLDDNRRLITECNEKIEAYEDELLDLPKEIDRVNYELMLQTMDVCYDMLKENAKEIETIGEWIGRVRRELKKNLVRKREKEVKTQQIYSYMHDVFGAEVIEIFDMKYFPDKLMNQLQGKNMPEDSGQ